DRRHARIDDVRKIADDAIDRVIAPDVARRVSLVEATLEEGSPARVATILVAENRLARTRDASFERTAERVIRPERRRSARRAPHERKRQPVPRLRGDEEPGRRARVHAVDEPLVRELDDAAARIARGADAPAIGTEDARSTSARVISHLHAETRLRLGDPSAERIVLPRDPRVVIEIAGGVVVEEE